MNEKPIKLTQELLDQGLEHQSEVRGKLIHPVKGCRCEHCSRDYWIDIRHPVLYGNGNPVGYLLWQKSTDRWDWASKHPGYVKDATPDEAVQTLKQPPARFNSPELALADMWAVLANKGEDNAR